MAGDVDKADLAEMRKPEVDRDTAALFFFQPVRVDPGERADQRSLAMVDVSGSAYDERNVEDLLLRFYRLLMNVNEHELV